MEQILTIALLTLLAGMAIPLGAVLAREDRIHPNWLNNEFRHGIMAFGGGALLSAVALVLVPEGLEVCSLPLSVACFLGGGLVFLLLDMLLSRLQSKSSQLVAMLADYLPEAIALGASFASGHSTAVLLAVLIALQNLPEGFNAYREMIHKQVFIPGQGEGRKLIFGFCGIALLGPVAGLSGYFFLAHEPVVVGSLMLFASGGILYLVFQDIAPEARVQRRWLPAFGAVLGFMLGMVGKMLI